jgi:hypothetical protein
MIVAPRVHAVADVDIQMRHGRNEPEPGALPQRGIAKLKTPA